ncbi:MAG: putative rane protein [Blastocatellia bacterium]|nr:putative rane protein [Blastocatellia bacterium]
MIWKRTFSFISPVCIMAIALLLACSSAKDSTKFAANAAQGGMMEVELGRLALQHAGDASVRSFGQRMVTDHTAANAELKGVAARKNIQLPADVSSDQKSMIDKLSKLSGAEFDKEYISDMVKDHETDVKDFQNQASEGSDPDVKAFAGKTLPTLQSHLQMARDTAKKVGAQ